MEPDALSPGSSPYYDFVYNNESVVEPAYWPLVLSQMQTKRAANELYTDDPSQYIAYSGSWQSLLVAREKEDRYRNFSIRAYSGDSFNFYISIPSGESSTYYSGPLTTSGNYAVLTEYALENDAQQFPVIFQAPQDNTRVYTLPSVKAVDWIRLHHESVVSGQAYRIYQFLPRTLIQVDDLEAEVIDAVTIRVSDSIVIGPDMIGDKTILGQKIVDGTVSGILLTDGTITGSKIQANTISGALITAGTITTNLIAVSGIDADRINVSTLSALATNTGSLNVTGTITVSGASSEIDAGFTRVTQSGIIIGRIAENLPISSILKFSGRPDPFLINSPVAGFYIPNDDTNPPTERLIASLGISQYNSGVTDFLVQQNDSAGVVVNMPTVDTTDIQRTSFTVRVGNRAYGNANAAEPQFSVNRDEVRLYSTPLKILSAGSSIIWPPGSTAERISLANTGITVRNSTNQDMFTINSNTGDAYIARDLRVDRNSSLGGALNVLGSTTLGLRLSASEIYPSQYINYNYASKTKNTAQTVNAGADGLITFQVSATNSGLGSPTDDNAILAQYAGLYLVLGGVVSSNVTGQTWQLVINSSSFGTGVILNGVTQSDNRAYNSKLIYLAANTVIRLVVRNSSGTNMTVSTGTNGTILSAVKVG